MFHPPVDANRLAADLGLLAQVEVTPLEPREGGIGRLQSTVKLVLDFGSHLYRHPTDPRLDFLKHTDLPLVAELAAKHDGHDAVRLRVDDDA
jgi:hypothetical protein